MKNVASISGCYGCGVCAAVCPKRVIDMELNGEGFYEPRVEDAGCVACGLCVACCSYLDDEVALSCPPVASYAAWSRDPAVRRKCSSGGVGFEVGRALMERGYKVCGVRYQAERGRAEHYVASTPEELIPSIGSKYIQSYTLDGFRAVDLKGKYLVTGTPCQIDSFRRYIRKFKKEDHFFLLDFFCHGVPSMHVWEKYVRQAETVVGKLTYASWRNKTTGWHDSWAMSLDGEGQGEKVDWHDSYHILIRGKKSFLNSRLSRGDAFFGLFLSDACLGRACYDRCKFKYDHSAADIRIGDLWGPTYRSNEEGVSGAVAFTEKGDELLRNCGCTLTEHAFATVAEGQMKTPPCRPSYHQHISKLLAREDTTIGEVYASLRRYQNRRKWIHLASHPGELVKKALRHVLLILPRRFARLI